MIRAAVPLNLIENGRISTCIYPVPWAWQSVSLTNEGKRIECKEHGEKEREKREKRRTGKYIQDAPEEKKKAKQRKCILDLY